MSEIFSKFLVVLWIVGVVAILAGWGGFVDTRSVDRRFRTGYKHNAIDTRNKPRAQKRLLFGIALCFVAAGLGSLHTASQSTAPEMQIAAAPASSDRVPEVPVNASSPVEIANVPQAMPNSIQPTNEAPAMTQTIVASAPASILNTRVTCDADGTYFGQVVCQKDALSSEYKRVLEEYEAAQSRLGGADLGVQREQERWLAKVKQDCVDESCLLTAFGNRAAELSSRYRKGN